MISTVKSRWEPVNSSILQELIMGPILHSIFVNDLNDWTEFTLSVFVDDTKLRGMVNTPGGCAASLGDFNKPEKWTDMI